jgi:DNA-binding response OmpR family regulator
MTKVLVVDDIAKTRLTVVRRLEKWGFQVDTALNGEKLLKKIGAFSPNAIIMGMGLLMKDGLEAASVLKKDPTTSQIVIIAVSPFTTDSDRKRAIEAGYDEYFAIPYDFTRLATKIDILTRCG